MIKSYKLTYEPVHVQHEVFDRSRTENQWTIEPRFLREVADHFSPSAEQLDIYSEGDKAMFTSFTTKIADGKGNVSFMQSFAYLALTLIRSHGRNPQTTGAYISRH